MNDPISIKVKISDRVYDMSVFPQEEKIVRLAAKTINDKLSIYGSNLGTNEKQDLLSIVCFDTMVDLLKERERNICESEQDDEILSKIEAKLSAI